MFKLAVQTGGITNCYDLDETYRLIAETGFEGVDANINRVFETGDIRTKKPIPAVLRKETDEKELIGLFRPWKEAARKYGLENEQAHAIFPSMIQIPGPENEAYNEALLEALRRNVIGCAFIDCRNLVIHPFYYNYDNICPSDEEWEMNRKSYLRLADTAKEYGVTICLENMFRVHRGKCYTGTCGTPEEAVSFVDRLNEEAGSKVFGFCLDTGHALLGGVDLKKFILALGDRISCFHVHDNNGIDDQHLAPYMGIQDWNKLIEGLAEIRYEKTLSFETFNIWNVIEPELCPNMLKFIEQSGRFFDRRAEALAK